MPLSTWARREENARRTWGSTPFSWATPLTTGPHSTARRSLSSWRRWASKRWPAAERWATRGTDSRARHRSARPLRLATTAWTWRWGSALRLTWWAKAAATIADGPALEIGQGGSGGPTLRGLDLARHLPAGQRPQDRNRLGHGEGEVPAGDPRRAGREPADGVVVGMAPGQHRPQLVAADLTHEAQAGGPPTGPHPWRLYRFGHRLEVVPVGARSQLRPPYHAVS